jgi:hypothetical protein
MELAAEETYVAQRSETKKIMRKALCNFKNKILSELLDESPESFWSYTRELQGKTSIEDSLFDKNGEFVTNNFKKANLLNKHFGSVYAKEDSLQNAFIPIVLEPIREITIQRSEVIKQLRSIKSNKSRGKSCSRS